MRATGEGPNGTDPEQSRLTVEADTRFGAFGSDRSSTQRPTRAERASPRKVLFARRVLTKVKVIRRAKLSSDYLLVLQREIDLDGRLVAITLARALPLRERIADCPIKHARRIC